MWDVVAYVEDQNNGMEFTYEFQLQYKKQLSGFLQDKNLKLVNLIKCQEVKRSDAEKILQALSKAII